MRDLFFLSGGVGQTSFSVARQHMYGYTESEQQYINQKQITPLILQY